MGASNCFLIRGRWLGDQRGRWRPADCRWLTLSCLFNMQGSGREQRGEGNLLAAQTLQLGLWLGGWSEPRGAGNWQSCCPSSVGRLPEQGCTSGADCGRTEDKTGRAACQGGGDGSAVSTQRPCSGADRCCEEGQGGSDSSRACRAYTHSSSAEFLQFQSALVLFQHTMVLWSYFNNFRCDVTTVRANSLTRLNTCFWKHFCWQHLLHLLLLEDGNFHLGCFIVSSSFCSWAAFHGQLQEYNLEFD